MCMLKKNWLALAGNWTRASRVAGENSTTEPPMLAHPYNLPRWVSTSITSDMHEYQRARSEVPSFIQQSRTTFLECVRQSIRRTCSQYAHDPMLLNRLFFFSCLCWVLLYFSTKHFSSEPVLFHMIRTPSFLSPRVHGCFDGTFRCFRSKKK